jgi:hypothetical protein
LPYTDSFLELFDRGETIMDTLRKQLIKLAHENPELRSDLLPLIKEGSVTKQATDFNKFRQDLVNVLGDQIRIYEQAMNDGHRSFLETTERFQGEISDLTDTGNTLSILIGKGESRRLGRAAQGVRITDAKEESGGNRITAHPAGSRGEKYDTRITLAPRRGHHCTCMDWQQRGRSVGPCKHVLALALHWQNNELIPELESLQALIRNLAAEAGM